jgi:hypothetical protein
MIRENQVRGIAHQQIAPDLDSQVSQSIDLLDQRNGINDDAIPDHTHFAAAQNSRRNQMQNIFLPAMNDSMAGVVTPLASHNNIGVGDEDVDDFPLSFVAPLRADQDRVGHDVLGKILSRRALLEAVGTAPKNKSDDERRKTILAMSGD